MSTIKGNTSNDSMQNNAQAAIVSSETKFEALQTQTGASLLFSIGTDNVFYVAEEVMGNVTGWTKTDLSATLIEQFFPESTSLTCKTFEVKQSVIDGTIGMAMVINDGTSDHFFVCLGNSNADTSWANHPKWIQYPFDNPTKNVIIANVFISETNNNAQYIVVDILRDAFSPEKLISRYYINASDSTIPIWQPLDATIYLEVGNYSSCLGRPYLSGSMNQYTIDGLYTFVQENGNALFVFQFLFDIFDPEIPEPTASLYLPNNMIPDAMAVCRTTDLSTDLYVCSDGGLYFFANTNQNNNAVASLLMQNTIFTGVKKMYAFEANGLVTILGLNGNNEVFYTSCQIGQQLATTSAWTLPETIISNVDSFSPYINCVDYGITIFSVAGGMLKKSVKSVQNGTWQTESL